MEGNRSISAPNSAKRRNSRDTLSSKTENEYQNHLMKDMDRCSSSRSYRSYTEGCTDDSINDTTSDGYTVMLEDDEDEGEALYGNHRKRDFSVGAPPDTYVFNDWDSIERKERHRRVIRNILAGFDLEKVKDRYRGGSLKRNLSHGDRRFRQWLISAMGSEKIDLCDKKWNEQFRQKVMEEYERQQIRREQQLANAEIQRIQNLRLHGVLRNEDDEEGKKRFRKRASKKRAKKKSGSSMEAQILKHQTLYKHPNEDVETQIQALKNRSHQEKDGDGEEDSSKEMHDQNDQGTHLTSKGEMNGDRSSSRNKSDNEPSDDHSEFQDEEEGEGQRNGRKESSESSLSDDPDFENRVNQSYNSQLGRADSSGHQSHTELRRLYDQEDLRELYAEAEALLRMSDKRK